MAQTNEVVERLRTRSPGLDVEVVGVRTQADASPEASLAAMGRGMFVKELEDALLRGEVDLAVHSLKDLPTVLPDGLAIAAICQRADARDVLVNRWGCSLAQLPAGARIGTSSPRRPPNSRTRGRTWRCCPCGATWRHAWAKPRGQSTTARCSQLRALTGWALTGK